MGGFNPPVPQQDNNWEIRVAVLLSLFLQVLMLFNGNMRRRSSNSLYRITSWSCYLLSDWVADLALGLLLNNMGNIGGHGGSSSSSVGLTQVPGGGGGAPNTSSPIIFAFWTPFLLVHLGGQDNMTSYSMQDNDLWPRHLIGLLFELFSACVIFFCSLQGNPMLPATILMFIVGIIKYGERTYSLYYGSVDSVLAAIGRDPDPGSNYAKLMTEFNTEVKAGLDVEIGVAEGEASKALEELEQEEIILKMSTKSLVAQAYYFFNIYRGLCFDFKLSYKDSQISRGFFLEQCDMTPTKAFQVIEVELNFIYDMVHTKAPIAHSKTGCVLRFIGSTCIVSALLIFFFHHKSGFTRVDIAITYALLLGSMTFDVATLVMLLVSGWTLAFLEETLQLAWLVRAVKFIQAQQRRWSETTMQLNFINYCSFYGHPQVVRVLIKVAEKLHGREVFDYFFIQREDLSWQHREEFPLLQFLFDGLKYKAAIELKYKAIEPNTYEEMTKVCNYRGDGVLIHDEGLRKDIINWLTEETRLPHGQPAPTAIEGGEKEEEEKVITKLVEEKLAILVGSIQREFNESLLLWHIATDLCFHPLPKFGPDRKTIEVDKAISKTLSEYMLYLLIKQPEILFASAYRDRNMQARRLVRYREIVAEAERLFESAAARDPDHEEPRKMLLNINTTEKPSEVKGDRSKSVLFDAVILAKVLRELDADLMWEVVARVWGEMFTYAAGKCRGSTHVRQLSRGGELITMVWFLMAHMGLGDMYQIHEETPQPGSASITCHV